MLSIPITEQARQKWNTMRTIPRNNGFSLQIIRNLNNKLILKTQKNTLTQTQERNGSHLHITVHSYTELPKY